MTVDAAIGGRLMLGSVPRTQFRDEDFFGLSFDKPAAHTRDYSPRWCPLLAGQVLPAGEGRAMEVRLTVPGGAPAAGVPRGVGAEDAGHRRRADQRDITWLTPATVIRDHIRPLLEEGASSAGRPRPEVVCGLPVCHHRRRRRRALEDRHALQG